MGKIGRGFVFIRNKLDYILSVILLFILLSPTAVWDMEYGGLTFYFVVFPVLVVLLAVVCAADYIGKRPGFCAWIRENPWLVAFGGRFAGRGCSLCQSAFEPVLSPLLSVRGRDGRYPVYGRAYI